MKIMKLKLQGKLAIMAGIMIASLSCQASFVDASILINKAANNKTLTVSYEGAAAAIVEMRINGVSIASKEVNGKVQEGSASFDVNTAALKDGENTIEIRLIGKDGRVLGTETTTIKINRSGDGPVMVTSPKPDEKVQGRVEIKVGFKTQLRNVYVSFFVDDNFKALKNFAPYSFSWDTTTTNNGWHEVSAWVVDDSSATFKTEKVRVFVNNPGGRTEREDPPVVPPTKEEEKTPVKSNPAGLPPATQAKATATNGKTVPVQGKAAGQKQEILPNKTSSSGSQMFIEVNKPGQLTAMNNKPAKTTEEKTPPLKAPKLEPVAITTGTRLADVDKLNISLNGKEVKFDVNPSITNGIALTPFRHLFESAGGEVKWDHEGKIVQGLNSGQDIWFQIGNAQAKVNGNFMTMEIAPYILSGRSIVPLSFVSDALKVDVMYDASTGHVLISSRK